jgi:hypothetical protein
MRSITATLARNETPKALFVLCCNEARGVISFVAFYLAPILYITTHYSQ